MDRFNPNEVLPLLPFIDEDSSSLYEYMTTVWEKRRVSDKYKYGNYHTNAPAIALSTWSRARKIIMCGTPGYEGRTSFCHNVRYCALCAGRKARLSYVRYQQSFKKARHWYALTYSFKSNVFLTTASKEDYLGRWKVADSFIRSLRTAGYLNGAFAVKELSINSIAGKAVFPHTHTVFNSDREDLINDDILHPFIQEEAAKENVSIRLTRITDESTFLYEVKYPLKPLNIQSLYEAETNCTPTEQLNLNLDFIFARTSLYEDHTQKVVYYGNMDPRCKSSYIGTNMKTGKRKQASTKELNSSVNTATLGLIRKESVTDSAMSIPLQSPVPVLPPQRKKRTNYLLPVLGTLGVSAAAIAADHHFNAGRALNSLKSLFAAAPVPNPLLNATPAVAQAAKGLRSGSDADYNHAVNDHINFNSADYPTVDKLPVLPPKIRASPYVMKAPDDFGGYLADQAAARLANNSKADSQYAGMLLDRNLTASKAQGVATAFGVVDPRRRVGSNISDTALDDSGRNLPLNTVPYVAEMGNNRFNPGVRAAVAQRKSLQDAATLLGNGQLLEHQLPALPRSARWLGKATTGVSALGGVVSGQQAALNPLVLESLRDAHPDWTDEQITNYSRTVNSAKGGIAAGMFPLAGTLGTMGVSSVLDSAANQVRNMKGTSDEMDVLGDMLLRTHRGVLSGKPGYPETARTILDMIDQNPQLTENINTGGPGVGLGWDYMHPFSGTGGGANPEYVTRRLIDQLRSQIATH